MAGDIPVIANMRHGLAEELYRTLQAFVREMHPVPSGNEPGSAQGLPYLGDQISSIGRRLTPFAERQRWEQAAAKLRDLRELTDRAQTEFRALQCLNDLRNLCDSLGAGRGKVASIRTAIYRSLDELMHDHLGPRSAHPRYTELMATIEPLLSDLANLAGKG